jgi:hypothetical protein
MKLTNFAIIGGENGKIEADGFSYATPKEIKPEAIDDETRVPVSVRSDYVFSNGTIKFKFLASNYKSGVWLRFLKHSDTEDYILVGHSFDMNTFMICDEKSTPEQFAIKAGSLKNYDLEIPHEMKVEVLGSLIQMFIDDVLILKTNMQLKEAPLMFKIASMHDIKVFDIEVKQKRQIAFIVMQFSKEYDELYAEVIRPVCEERGILRHTGRLKRP